MTITRKNTLSLGWGRRAKAAERAAVGQGGLRREPPRRIEPQSVGESCAVQVPSASRRSCFERTASHSSQEEDMCHGSS
eukprot:180531-Rhodomonas_salina.1